MGGRHFWRLAIFDFRDVSAVGELCCVTYWSDKSGNKRDYDVKGALRDSRLVLFIKEIGGTEDAAVEIFPFASETFRNEQCGFWVMVTWDGNHALMPTILSREALHGCNHVGDISDSLTAAGDMACRHRSTRT